MKAFLRACDWAGPAIGLGLAASLILALASKEESADPMPSIGTIESMHIVYFPPGSRETFEFDVLPADMATILGRLGPVEPERRRLKCQQLGEIQCRLKPAGHVLISLSFRSELVAGIMIHTESGKRLYYRGGDTSQLDLAIRAAYQASRSKT